MVMTHTRYQSLGVGLPYSPAEGILTNTPDGKFILKMDRPYKTVKLRTAVQAKPRIIHKIKSMIFAIYMDKEPWSKSRQKNVINIG